MGYDMFFDFKDEKIKKKYDEICKKEDSDNTLVFAGGWDYQNFANYLKGLGEVKVTKTDDPYFDIKEWVMPVSKLRDVVEVYDKLKKAGVCEIFETIPDGYDIETYFYNEILGCKYDEQAYELVNNLDKYSDISDEGTVKALRLADLEYADSLRERKNKLTRDFNDNLNEALSGVDYDLKEYIKEYLPWSLFILERVKDMSERLIKLFGRNCELVLGESY